MATSPGTRFHLDVDPLWTRIRAEAQAAMAAEPALSALLHGCILSHATFEDALVARLVTRLEDDALPGEVLREAFNGAIRQDPALRELHRIDLVAVLDRDPAARRAIEPLLYFKGYHAIETHRFAHRLWHDGRRDLALFVQARSSSVFQVDIHPAARLGRGIFLDHATGLVIGETADVGDGVSFLQGVSLGGSGTTAGRRHPRIGDDVLIGAGAQIIGPIVVGRASRIGAGSVIVESVPANVTVAGVPARVVGMAGSPHPGAAMDQMLYDVGL